MSEHDHYRTEADPPDDHENDPIEGVNPDREGMWSVTVHLEPCPPAMDLGEYCHMVWEHVGGFLHDRGHVERQPLSLEARVECTTTELLYLFRRTLWKRFHITDVVVETLPGSADVGGEG